MSAPTAPAPAMTHREILVVLGGLMTGLLLAALDQTIVSTALPTIVGELGGLTHLSWVVTAYLLTSTASTPLYGKISDLYGRKPVFQFAIVVFLVGSVLAGLSQEMWQLVATRAVQGLGAGGLMALTLAIIGDIIPPRERGRYQGFFGAVFGLSSVLGPLLGGFFVDNLTWRWIFWINLPLGLLALVATSATLHLPHRRREHSIDYLGAALLVAAVSSILLGLVQGQESGWTGPQVPALFAAGVALGAAFVWWESRAAEPILPLRLFGNSIFSVTNAVAFVLGFGMFGAIVFLPIYLQIVQGASPTVSGLLLLPLVLGILTASMGSGQAITRTGRYKVFPVVGTAVMTVGLLLLSRLDAETPRWLAGSYMLVFGLGLGLVMQVLVIAVQNAVDTSDLGVATSANAFFRSMGGTFGTAIFGAILSAQLTSGLARRLPGGGAVDPASVTGSPAAIAALPPGVREPVIASFVDALQVVYLTAAPITLVAFGLTLLLREIRLRSGSDADEGSDSGAPDGGPPGGGPPGGGAPDGGAPDGGAPARPAGVLAD